MRGFLLGLTFLAGTLGLIGSALWSLAGAGIFGSPFAGRTALQAGAIIVLLVIGPVSLIPAGLVARKRPVAAGLYLVASSAFTFSWHLGVIMNEGFRKLFRSNPSFEAWIPVALLSGVPLLLGCGFLWVSRSALATTLASLKTPANRRRLQILAVGVAVSFLLVVVYRVLTAPSWEITVRPTGKPAATLRFDPLKPFAQDPQLERLFQPLFDSTPDPATVTVLGKVEIASHKGPQGMVPTRTLTLIADHSPQGFLIVRLDDTPIHYYFEVQGKPTPEVFKSVERNALANARKHMPSVIRALALEEYPTWRR